MIYGRKAVSIRARVPLYMPLYMAPNALQKKGSAVAAQHKSTWGCSCSGRAVAGCSDRCADLGVGRNASVRISILRRAGADSGASISNALW